MRKKKESDHSLTISEESSAENKTAEEAKPAEVKEESKPKVRSGVFGLVAIFSSIVLLIVAFINPFNSNGEFYIDSNTDITIKLNLTSADFLIVSSKNVCDGSGANSGIKTSTAFATAKNLNESAPIGTGQLNDQGKCEYEIKIPTSDDFKGGTVDFSFKFPFGKSRVFSINVGDRAPYSDALIEIPLD